MSHTTLTPYANLTDTEIVSEVANKTDPTDLEVELMLRVEKLLHELEVHGIPSDLDNTTGVALSEDLDLAA